MLINNPHMSQIKFYFEHIEGRNILDLSGNPGMKEVGCMRMMPLHSLNLQGSGLPDKETLLIRGMPLEELNVAAPRITNFGFLRTLPNLKRLIISKGQMPAKLRRKWRKVVNIIEK